MSATLTPLTGATGLDFVSYNEDFFHARLADAPTYLTGNLRALAHQGINGALYALSSQTAAITGQPAPSAPSGALESVYFAQEIMGRPGPAAWFELQTGGDPFVPLTDQRFEHVTGYRDGVIPETQIPLDHQASGLSAVIRTVAPLVSAPGAAGQPAAVIYALTLVNTEGEPVRGRVGLRLAGDLFRVGGDALEWRGNPGRRMQRDGAANGWSAQADNGISLTVSGRAAWQAGPTPDLLTLPFDLPAGECLIADCVFAFASGGSGDAARLTSSSVADWEKSTAEAWQATFGSLEMTWAGRLPAFTRRSVVESLLCIRVDGEGAVVGLAPSPAPHVERTELADALLIGLPALYLQPGLFVRLLEWCATHPLVTANEPPFDTPARVMPAVMLSALQSKVGDAAVASLSQEALANIGAALETVLPKAERVYGLFPTDVLFGYTPLMAYEFGTNVACWAAFNAWSRALAARGDQEGANQWQERAANLHKAIQRYFAALGPGPGGWALGGSRPPSESMVNAFLYFEGDALNIALAPYLGFCPADANPWRNTMNHMFSPSYEQLVLRRKDTMLWWEAWNAHGLERREKHTSPSQVTRLAAVTDDRELEATWERLNEAIETNGTLRGELVVNGARQRIRSGRQMGAAFWILIDHLLGIRWEVASGKLECEPLPAYRTAEWRTPADAAIPVHARFQLGEQRAHYTVENAGTETWHARIGVRFPKIMHVEQITLDGAPCDPTAPAQDDGDWRTYWVDSELRPGARLDVRFTMGWRSESFQGFQPMAAGLSL
jgi:hypothetical protein